MKTKPQETTEKKRCKVCNHFHEYNCWCRCPAIPVEDFNASLGQKPDQPEKEDWEKLEVLLQLMPDNGNLIRGLVNDLLAKQKEEIIEKLEEWMRFDNDIVVLHRDQWDSFIEAIKQI